MASSAPERQPPIVADAWLRVLRRYFLFVALANLAWEVAHLPLYTIWWESGFRANTFAVVHCTGGDLLIATASLVLALLCFAKASWPDESYIQVAAAAVAFGVGYTVFSEWLNTEVRSSWAYTDRMPVVPFLGPAFPRSRSGSRSRPPPFGGPVGQPLGTS